MLDLLASPIPWNNWWDDPRVIWGIAVVAVGLLLGTWFLARRRSGKMNRAAMACGIVSVLLHVALILLLPYAKRTGGGATTSPDQESGTVAVVSVATFSDAELVDSAADIESLNPNDAPSVPPLPVSEMLAESYKPDEVPVNENKVPTDQQPQLDLTLPEDLSAQASANQVAVDSTVDDLLAELLESDFAPADTAPAVFQPVVAQPVVAQRAESVEAVPASAVIRRDPVDSQPAPIADAGGVRGRVLGQAMDDFANRRGAAREQAIQTTGGDERTEAAVEAGIVWLTRYQRPDGSWDPIASGAGIERSVLGQHRSNAGTRATTGISGLALLSMLGAGNTHQEGQHQQAVRSGLQYLLTVQAPDGSMAGEADPYARTYCHGMAALAMCETAAMTGDLVARDSAKSAAGYTLRMQHPTTGGWRYVAGDPGDMSQLGWQAMVLASARRAGVEIPERVIERTQRFLKSVRAGTTGGLASYKPGEAPSRTMTAEALATRLLLGERVPANEIAEAEAFILAELPGTGPDNYYYWYYASLALHQLQDDAWRQWNERMKNRLLETQLPDGSWSTATVWGGNGGKVYTTSMACLCLEVYYRHAVPPK